MSTAPEEDGTMSNRGHGHVIPRPDGAKARCGGPAICQECARELAQVPGEILPAEVQDELAEPRCPECGVPLAMHHDPMCSQPCGQCEALESRRMAAAEAERREAAAAARAELAAAIQAEVAAVAKILQDGKLPAGGPAAALRDALSAPLAVISRLVEADGHAEAAAETRSDAAKLAAITALCRRKAAEATLNLGFWIHPRNVRVDAADILKIIGGPVPPLTGDEINAAAGARGAAS